MEYNVYNTQRETTGLPQKVEEFIYKRHKIATDKKDFQFAEITARLKAQYKIDI